MRTVTLIPGDGTGPELTTAMRRVVEQIDRHGKGDPVDQPGDTPA